MVTRWGILGTGGVANAFAEALRDVPDARLVAVGSRTIEKARHFAGVHCAARAYGSYEELVGSPTVDVVYVATPASHHYRHALLAPRVHKHVLVEKPFTATSTQALALQHEARERGLFLMEAMWPRFLPSWTKLREVLASGAIGEVRALAATFGGRAEFNPRTRPFRLELCGGALMDAAVYPIHLAQMVLDMDEANEVRAVAALDDSGVDEHVLVAMRCDRGRLASVLGGLRTTFDSTATIYGTEGLVVMPGFTFPGWFRVDRPGQPPETHDFDQSRHRLAWQVDEFHRCVAAGATESPVVSALATSEVMTVLDAARTQIGLRFPDDVEAV